VRLGRTSLRFDVVAASHARPLSRATSFGTLAGASAAMRETYALLEKAAPTDATVLLEGETGTGKGAAAESLHAAGPRSAKPFIVVDCASMPPALLESELFGHEKGAFTGAVQRRIGAFEECDGGTLFLDEVGELPPDLQPKLLRVLENRQIRRLGRNTYQPVSFRLVAATNRDLRAEVNAGRFRADLYFRLAVVKIPMPALRQRPEDLPAIARQILGGMVTPSRAEEILTTEVLASLASAAWPGNVRELRNYLERCVVLGEQPPPGDAAAPPPLEIDASVPYAEARERAIAGFERRYVEDLLRRHGGKVVAAARGAGMTREYLYRLLVRHGLK
jgi:DNA-binding NtrC family response regulator